MDGVESCQFHSSVSNKSIRTILLMRRIKKIDRLDSKEHHFIVSQLKRVGLTVTTRRLAILSAFYDGDSSDLTAHEIYCVLQKEQKPVPLATIYSVINHLSASGILAVSSRIDGVKSYELNYAQYASHLICYKCGCRIKFFNNELIELCKQEIGKYSFEDDVFSLSINGLCKACSV